MKSIEIKGKIRKDLGKRASRDLRNIELVPCIVYGEGAKPIHFYTEEKCFKILVYTSNVYTVTIKLENKKINAILSDIQFHPVSDAILHADFLELNPNKSVIIEIPVHLTGRSKGVVIGGTLQLNIRKLRLKALPSKFPDEIMIDVTKLQIGDKICIKQIKNEDYTLLHPDNSVIVTVKMSRSAMKSGTSIQSEE